MKAGSGPAQHRQPCSGLRLGPYVRRRWDRLTLARGGRHVVALRSSASATRGIPPREGGGKETPARKRGRYEEGGRRVGCSPTCVSEDHGPREQRSGEALARRSAGRCTRGDARSGMCVVESCDCVPVRVGGGSSALVWLCKHTKGGRVMESKWGAVLVRDASAAAREVAHEVSPASGLPQDGRRAAQKVATTQQPAAELVVP